MSAFRGRGGWIAKFQMDGKQRWVPGGPWESKRQAQEAERRYRDRLKARRSDETCATFAERWLREWPRESPATRRHYGHAAKRFADEFGPTPLGEVERLSARTWALTVPRNISKVIGTLYEDARNVGLVDDNPFSNLRLPTTEKTAEVLPPDGDEFRQLLAACTVLGGYGPEFRAMIQFGAWTGIRAGELHALRWTDIDGDYVHVRRSLKTDLTIGKPKNGQERTIAFLEPARVLDQVPRREGSDLIFHSVRGVPLNKGSHHYAWRTVRAASQIKVARDADGLPDIRWHDLRHFCATQLLEMGVSHFDVSVQLGHEDGGRLVMERYGHPSKDAARGRLLAAFSNSGAEIGSRTGSGVGA
jgi:integrase